jgi:transglutaminase-like putative cysteine protease
VNGILFWLVVVPVALGAGVVARRAGLVRLQPGEGALDVELRRSPSSPGLRLHLDMAEGWVTYLIMLWLVLLTASTVAASRWVPGSDSLVPLSLAAVVASLLLTKLAPRGTTYWLAVEATGVLAVFVATSAPGGGLGGFTAWIVAISRSLELAVLVCMGGMAWLAVAWTGFWIARRHNFAAAVAPMAVVLAIEVINDPLQQDLYLRVGAWIVLAALFALRLNAVRLIRRWREAGNEQLAWSVSVEGGRALAVLMVLAFALPPLSYVDLSTRLFANTPGRSSLPVGRGPGASGSPAGSSFFTTGYTETVAPGGTLHRSNDPVLQVKTAYAGTVYWGGVALYRESGGVWSGGGADSGVAQGYPAGALIQATPGAGRATIQTTFTVIGQPQPTIFSPGEPERVDVPVVAYTDAAFGGLGALPDGAVSTVYAHPPVPVRSKYTVTASVSQATEAQLRADSQVYPALIRELTGLSPRPPVESSQVRQLALKIVRDAGATNPYDEAKAIEAYLRGGALAYRLTIDPPPAGTDPVVWFLFKTHAGYCEYFASSMGELARSLGLPVRLVNGYGPGDFDDRSNVYTVHASDAHTWVEVYFPTYGWVPFEPTPDGTYTPIPRGQPSSGPTPPAGLPTPGAIPPAGVNPPGGGAAPGHGGLPFDPRPLLGGLLLLAALWVAAAAVRGGAAPADVAGPWRRLLWLARRVGVRPRPQETPLELCARLGGVLPRWRDEIISVGRVYSAGRYSREGVAGADLERLRDAWAPLRAGLLPALLLGRRRGSLPAISARAEAAPR